MGVAAGSGDNAGKDTDKLPSYWWFRSRSFKHETRYKSVSIGLFLCWIIFDIYTKFGTVDL